MITNIVIEERELDGSYVGPIKVEVAQDLQVQNLDGLSEFKKEIEAIKDDAKVSADNSAQSATDAAASATAIQGIEATVTQKAQEVENNANTVATGVAKVASDTAKAVKSATDAAASETLAKQYATNPEDSEVGTTGEYSALHWATKAKTYAQALASGVTYRGEWDASKGVFPTPTLSPERIDYYRIKVAGTMSNSQNPNQPDVTVSINDALFWNDVKDIWYEIESTGVHSVNGKTPDPAGDVVVTANDIDLSDGESIQTKFDDNIWISACRTKAEFNAWRDENKRLYPASGFESFGHHVVSPNWDSINEGMWVGSAAVPSSAIFMGTHIGGTPEQGVSESWFPRTLVAGVITDIYKLGHSTETYNCRVSLPEAEKGLRTFDSATGVSTVHASAAEAFEGLATNGNFRNGGDGWGGTLGTRDFSNNRVRMTMGASTLCYLVRDAMLQTGKSYTLSFDIVGASTTGLSLYNYSAKDISGAIAHTKSNGVSHVVHTFTAGIGAGTSTGIDIRSAGAVGTWVEITNIQLHLATEEVVTRRVDMGGGERFLRKVATADSYVYCKGNIQSEVTTANGVPTTVNTQRPSSYFDQYEGQNGGQKRGWDWTKLTIAQKLAIVSDYSNLLYWDGKDLYQWCLRVRTFAGAGNGDWLNVDSNYHTAASSAILIATPRTRTRVGVQGNQDVVQDTSGGGNFFAGTRNVSENGNPQVGVFTQSKNAGSGAVDGECYFQVWFTVPRLNRGAYHPEFNEFGANRLFSNSSGSGYWYESKFGAGITSTQQAFIEGGAGVGKFPQGGSIGSAASGREDGRFYDAIYASGLGGVNDYRVTCKDTGKPEYAAGKLPEIINGNYRGSEKLKFTSVHQYTTTGGGAGTALAVDNLEAYSIGDKVFVETPTVYVETYVKARSASSGSGLLMLGIVLQRKTLGHIVHTINSDITVSGEYYQKNIIGDPANILATFPNGGYWEWVPEIPDGTNKDYELSAPAVNSPSGVFTQDGGSSWGTTTLATFDPITNSLKSVSYLSTYVILLQYKTKARQTQPTTNKAILHGKAGIGDVFLSANYVSVSGRHLGYSLSGIITKSSSGTRFHESALKTYLIDPADSKIPSWFAPVHEDIRLSSPSNKSSGFKFLGGQVSENKQSNIQFHYRELNWNKPSLVTIGSANKDRAGKRGEVYKVLSEASGIMAGGYYRATADFSVHFDDVRWRKDNDGNIRFFSGSQDNIYLVPVNPLGDWGDDNKIHIIDNDGTLEDTNGISTRVGTHELVKPLGYTW